MFSVHLPVKGCMAWEDNLLAVGQDSLSLHFFQSPTFTQVHTLTPPSPISSLEWSKTSEVILASGSRSGALTFFKKSLLITEPSKSLIKEDKIFDHVAITNLQFCPSKPNLLAIGANELFIFNMEVGLTKQDPSRYVFKLGKNPMEGKRITSLAWNPQVQYILAAASQNCSASVWDLRGNQTLFNVHDSNYLDKSYCSAIAWNPDIPTQFIMAYDDLEAPNLQIWDLRKHEQPVIELKTHHKTGVTALTWCPYDTAIFASSDRSGFTNFWNFKKGEPFSCIQHEAGSVPTSIKWVPRNHGLLTIGSESGEIELRSIYTPPTHELKISHSDQPSDKTPHPFTPNWVGKKFGTSIGYNGKIASFVSNSKRIAFSSIKSSDSPLRAKVQKAQSMYIQGRLEELCRFFSESCKSDMKLQLEIILSKLNGNIFSVLSLLGFDRQAIEKNTEKYTGKKRGPHEEAPKKSKETNFNDNFSFVALSGDDAEAFFNSAGVKHEEVKQQVESRKSEPEFMQTISETISKNINWDEGAERLIRENIILGNLESAIDCALMCGRTAEALLIAAEGGSELFNITRETVLASSKDRYLRNSFLPLLMGNSDELIEKIDPEKWKEALTILIIKNCKPSVIIEFANKLEEQGLSAAAQACFLYAGCSEKILSSWIERFREDVKSGENYESLVFELFFNALLYAESFKYFESEALEMIYFEYLNMLFKCGYVEDGLEIMQHLKTPKFYFPLMVLIERHIKARTGASRPPWQVMKIVPVKMKEPVKPVEPDRSKQVIKPQDPYRPPPKEAVLTEPRKAAFPQPLPNKSAFAEDPPVSEINKNVNIKPAFPEPPADFKRPPNPPDFHKKSPFADDIQNKAQVGSKVTADKNLPPPPPPVMGKIKEAAKIEPGPPPVMQAPDHRPPPIVKPIERSAFPLENKAVSEVVKPDPVKNVKPEEKKVLNPPIVPRAVPPPRMPHIIPAKAEANPSGGNEGIDLRGIPSQYMRLASVWEAAIKDNSISSNQRVLKDVEAKMQDFFNKLRNQGFTEGTLKVIGEMTEAFEAEDFTVVNKAHLELTNKTWSENGNWLTGMKRIIQAKQNSRGNR